MQGSGCDEQDEDWKEQLVSESYQRTWNSNDAAEF